MQIDIKVDGDTATICVKGRLNTATAPEFDAAVAKKITRSMKTVVDMSELEFISSAGIRSIMRLRMTVGTANLRLIHATGLVREVFEISGITEILED